MKPCFFCELPADRILRQNKDFVVIRDNYPVTPGHTLIISRRHVETWFELSAEEQDVLNYMLYEEKDELQMEDPAITGFNIGMNCGASAGQTVMHFRCHLIPRRNGDMQDPRGGIRGVIPEKQKYAD